MDINFVKRITENCGQGCEGELMKVLIAPLFQAYVTEGASSKASIKASLIKSWRCVSSAMS